jgi:hypothetical protein
MDNQEASWLHTHLPLPLLLRLGNGPLAGTLLLSIT